MKQIKILLVILLQGLLIVGLAKQSSAQPGGCLAGWLAYDNHCFKIHDDQPLDWFNAQRSCQETPGADLAVIETKYINAFITSQTVALDNRLWIGLHSENWNVDPFVWVTGDPVVYSNWSTSEPNNFGGLEECAEIRLDGSSAGSWNDDRCQRPRPYLCSMLKNTTIQPGLQSNNNSVCAEGWIRFDTADGELVCFRLDTTLQTFEDARRYCQRMHADLASLQSVQDQAFITSYVKNQTTWLGMKLNPAFNDWEWVDGRSLQITSWASGQPGTNYTRECVIHRDSTLASEWATTTCSELHMALCETPPDVDECAQNTHNCHSSAECVNVGGHFTCACSSGYIGNGTHCTDIDECASDDTNSCHEHAQCSNTHGGYLCVCNNDYAGNGTHCVEAALLNDLVICEDSVNVTVTCPSWHVIIVTDGFYGRHNATTCGGGPSNCVAPGSLHALMEQCNELNSCILRASNDVFGDPCAGSNNYIGLNYYCENRDVDECATSTDNCHSNAACANNDGSFTCTCNPGYTGDGVVCSDIDECESVSNPHNCDENADCTNTNGSFTCACNTGFNGSGTECTDIDECASDDTNNCHEHAQCRNRPGRFDCYCNGDFRGNGTYCSPGETNALSVTCLPGAIRAYVSASYFLQDNVQLSELHLRDFSCKGFEGYIPGVWAFDVLPLTSCGTTVTSNDTHVVYSNTILNTVEGDMLFAGEYSSVYFACTFRRGLDTLSLFQTQYAVVRNVRNVTGPQGLGEITASLNHYTDNTYTTIDTRNEFVSTDTLYVMMKIDATAPGLNLVITRCWITPTLNLSHSLQHEFIEDSCPASDEITSEANLRIRRSGDGPSAQFESRIFYYGDYETTFLHCSLEICSSEFGDICIPACLSRTKRSLALNQLLALSRSKRQLQADDPEDVLTLGPFKVQRDSLVETVQPQASIFGLSFTTFVAILSAAVVVVLGVLAFVAFRIRGRRIARLSKMASIDAETMKKG